MIRGLGLDLVDIERIERVLARSQRFLERVYTPAEQAVLLVKGAQTAAGYFAAKEAVAKALGTGFRDFGPGSISIEPDELGKPVVLLSGKALERMQALGGSSIFLSITHVKGFASAVAVIE